MLHDARRGRAASVMQCFGRHGAPADAHRPPRGAACWRGAETRRGAHVDPSTGSIPAQIIEAKIGGGLKLAGRAWLALEPRAVIAILHGIGEHSGRYAALASDLVHAGYTVVALDLPGHGESPGPRGDVAS